MAASLPRFLQAGGVSSSSKASREAAGGEDLQWDWPFGWAPHQVIVVEGLRRYGFHAEADQVAYRWLSMVMDIAGQHNGLIKEKYDVVRRSADVPVEYGNQGADRGPYLRAALRADAGLRVDERVGAAAAERAVPGAAGDAGRRRAGRTTVTGPKNVREERQHAAAGHGLRREGAAGGYSARHGRSLLRNPDPLPRLQPLRGHVRRAHRGGERPHHLHPRG